MVNISFTELDNGIFRISTGNFDAEFNAPAPAWNWVKHQINNNFWADYTFDDSIQNLIKLL